MAQLVTLGSIRHHANMRTSHIITLLVVALLVVVSGCGKKEAAPDSTAPSVESKPEVVDVAALDKAGDEDLADPKKAEARRWFKAPSHAIFKGDQQAVIKFVDDVYAAGAVTVYVTGIETLGGNEVTETMLLVLPKDSAARARVIEVANRFGETIQNDPDKDVGQKYLSFVLD
jgi:hypothetical protein